METIIKTQTGSEVKKKYTKARVGKMSKGKAVRSVSDEIHLAATRLSTFAPNLPTIPI